VRPRALTAQTLFSLVRAQLKGPIQVAMVGLKGWLGRRGLDVDVVHRAVEQQPAVWMRVSSCVGPRRGAAEIGAAAPSSEPSEPSGAQ
jgi:hypothetical protein